MPPKPASAATPETDQRPPDIATMRESIGLLLPPDAAQAPTGEELATLTGSLRGHMELIIPEIEAAAVNLPKDDVPRHVAIACIYEARGRLGRAAAGPGHDALVYARRLARSLNALCDHYEALTGGRIH